MVLPTLFESQTKPPEVFDPWSSTTIESWSDLTTRINDILAVHGNADLYWRGVTNADYGLYSSLYRRLKTTTAKVDEKAMIAEEKRILARARTEWRFDHMPALEIFAHIQHYGGPTRLLDVTKNPLIAAWFAVEEQRDEAGKVKDATDTRIFCFYGGDRVELDARWGSRDPAWFNWNNRHDRRREQWGDGRNRRIWVPPAYNPRISAQNAAFILDGVPFSYPGANSFTMGPGQINERWHIGPVRDASSIPLKLNDHQRAKQTDESKPAFTIRVAASAVEDIRQRLELNYGFTASSLYADLFGLAAKVAPHLPA